LGKYSSRTYSIRHKDAAGVTNNILQYGSEEEVYTRCKPERGRGQEGEDGNWRELSS
jgi:hypothetical protein